MKARKKLSLRREALSDLRDDDLALIAGAATGLPCLVDAPQGPTVQSCRTYCWTEPVNECLISVTCAP